MSSPLTEDETKRYSQIIDGILSTADLATISRKRIRKGLEKAVGKDLRDQKAAITVLIEARFDAVHDQAEANEQTPTPDNHVDDEQHSPAKRGHAAISADTYHPEIKVSIEHETSDADLPAIHDPPKKKHKRSSSSIEDADARLAAELQAQEERLARGRTTRGGGPTKPRKKAPKKKSAARVKNGDGSDQESDINGVVKEKRKAGGGFQKPFNLSDPLGQLVGETQLSRPQVVKKLWEYIKGNELQDPSDKRQIRCDDMMQAVFKQSKVDMFQMNKLLGNHLYPVDEE